MYLISWVPRLRSWTPVLATPTVSCRVGLFSRSEAAEGRPVTVVLRTYHCVRETHLPRNLVHPTLPRRPGSPRPPDLPSTSSHFRPERPRNPPPPSRGRVSDVPPDSRKRSPSTLDFGPHCPTGLPLRSPPPRSLRGPGGPRSRFGSGLTRRTSLTGHHWGPDVSAPCSDQGPGPPRRPPPPRGPDPRSNLTRHLDHPPLFAPVAHGG